MRVGAGKIIFVVQFRSCDFPIWKLNQADALWHHVIDVLFNALAFSRREQVVIRTQMVNCCCYLNGQREVFEALNERERERENRRGREKC